MEEDIKSYAQDKEDLLIFDILKKNNLLRENKPLYFDIGVNSPIIMSNTYLFYTLGFYGVLIEPLPMCGDYIKKTRPRDIFVE